VGEELHQFQTHSSSKGDSGGQGLLTIRGNEVRFGRPTQLGGSDDRLSPEELLLAAVVSCYTITFGILAERRRLPVVNVDVDAEADVIQQLGGTLKYQAIRLKPRITLSGADENQKNTALDSAHKAEQYCVISNAVRGTVQITVEPDITLL
jgi:peroxiredoxin-like protein